MVLRIFLKRPVLVTERTSTGDIIQSVLVRRRISTGRMSDQYWLHFYGLIGVRKSFYRRGAYLYLLRCMDWERFPIRDSDTKVPSLSYKA